MRRNLLLVCGLLAMLCDASPGYAGSVFINDSKIDALTKEVVLRNVDVRIDVKGNVFITARGVKVVNTTEKTKAPPPQESATPTTAKRYYLVTMQNRVGATQYKVDLFVNKKWTRQVNSKNAQEIFEVTRYLKPGTNLIHLVATKDYGGGTRVSSSAADYYDVIIGEGEESQGRIMLTRKLVEFRRTAEETDTRQGAFKIDLK